MIGAGGFDKGKAKVVSELLKEYEENPEL